MTAVYKPRGYEYKNEFYIYPYEYNDVNRMLFMLEVNLCDNVVNYRGGVIDSSHDLFWLNIYTIELEEISKDEFEEKALDSVKHAIEWRLNRQKEKGICG